MSECKQIGNNGSISAETDKIDKVEPNGLSGAVNSLSYLAAKINGHFHNYERWLAAALAPNAELHVADPFSASSVLFVADGGNDTWGPWIQVAGSQDTPVQQGMLKFDFHRLFVAAWERNDCIYKIQIGVGASGADALANGTYTEFPIITNTGINNIAPVPFMSKGADSGSKIWFRTWAVGQNTGTLSFYLGIHEYEG